MAYTTIDDPSAYFQTLLYTGDASSSLALTFSGNSNLQPDLIWNKARSFTGFHVITDTNRGLTKNLYPNDASGEETYTDRILSIQSDGFTIGDDTDTMNKDSQTFANWCWKANGGTTTTNDASSTSVGTIDSVYQADTTAGFSIVTFTGTGSAGTIAHGLGSTPQVIITKDRGATENWIMHHHTLGATFIMRMDNNVVKVDAASYNDTLPASTVFSVDAGGNNQSGNTYVSYCFAEKQGYSKFGSYTGNANADGAFVYTGFKPAFVMLKGYNHTGQWVMQDTTRRNYQGDTKYVYANLSNAEATNSALAMDFLSNGFKLRSADDAVNSGDYIYMAFAEHPFVSSKGVPTTAR